MSLVVGTLIALAVIIAVTELSSRLIEGYVSRIDQQLHREAATALIIALDIVVLFKIIVWSPAFVH